jgi:hypothetical protein
LASPCCLEVSHTMSSFSPKSISKTQFFAGPIKR